MCDWTGSSEHSAREGVWSFSKRPASSPGVCRFNGRWAGVVDTVSGVMLAKALLQVKYGGAAGMA